MKKVRTPYYNMVWFYIALTCGGAVGLGLLIGTLLK